MLGPAGGDCWRPSHHEAAAVIAIDKRVIVSMISLLSLAVTAKIASY